MRHITCAILASDFAYTIWLALELIQPAHHYTSLLSAFISWIRTSSALLSASTAIVAGSSPNSLATLSSGIPRVSGSTNNKTIHPRPEMMMKT